MHWTKSKIRQSFLTTILPKEPRQVSCKILEHFALQVDPVIESIQLRSTPFKRWCHFGAKTSWSTFLLEKQVHPLYNWILFTWSGLTHIFYYLNMLVRWNTALRNQILWCQQVFYYTSTTTYVDDTSPLSIRFLIQSRMSQLLTADQENVSLAELISSDNFSNLFENRSSKIFCSVFAFFVTVVDIALVLML